MSINDTTDVVLYDPARSKMWLMVADRYIQQYEADPDNFVLPKQFAVLAPLINSYAGNLTGLIKYMVGIRDSLREAGYNDAALEVQDVQRRLASRRQQQIRRERADRAMAAAKLLYGAAPFARRMEWMARLEKVWEGRRAKFLNAHRAGRKRLPQAEKDEATAEFWDLIDNEIANGERIPPWEQ